jgi:lipopolysaccharide export system permease protein
MIRILDQLLARTFLKMFVVFLAASPPLFVLGDITEWLDTYLDRGLTPLEVAKAYSFMLPLFILWAFPLAALLAAVFTIHGMTTHREIVAAKAGGISFHRLAAPLFVMGILLTGVALVLSEIVPLGSRVATQILRADQDPRRSWRSDFVYGSEAGVTWQVGRMTVADSRMTEVVLQRPPTPQRAGLLVLAGSADYDAANGWTFENGYVRHLRADSTERAYQFGRLRVAGLDEKPEELLEAPLKPEEMTYAEVNRFARFIERSGGNAQELLVKREQKLSLPVATLVVILFGVPLATSSSRGGAAFGVGLSLGTTILYLLLFKVSGSLGTAGTLSPLAAAWLPNALFFVAALFLLIRVRT